MNRDLDTGRPVKPAGYRLTDDTYASLLHRLTATPTIAIPPGVQSELLAYYADLNLTFATKKRPEEWTEVQQELTTLRAMPSTTESDPFVTYGEDNSDVTSDAGARNPTN